MARKKTKTNTKARAAAPATPKKTATRALAAATAPSIDQLLVALPPITAEHRRAYQTQFTDVECMALGAKTRSEAVRDCGVAWAAEATKALANPVVGPEIDYAPERLTWFVELLTRLAAERAAADDSGGQQSAVRTVRGLALAKAKELRARLLKKLARVVVATELTSAQLADAGAAPTAALVARSLEAIATIVDAVTASADVSVRVRAESARVAVTDAVAARAAATALKDAKEDVALGGRAHGDRDTPAINVVEGRVLKEAIFLRNAMDDARARGVATPQLLVPTSLRHVLLRSHPKKGADADPEPTPQGGGPGA